MAALVDRVGRHSGPRDAIGSGAPRIAGLAAAMQEQHRAAALRRRIGALCAEHIADQAVCGLLR